MEPTVCPETWVTKYHPNRRNIPEQRKPCLHYTVALACSLTCLFPLVLFRYTAWRCQLLKTSTVKYSLENVKLERVYTESARSQSGRYHRSCLQGL